MPRFELEIEGQRFEVEAPDEQTALQALQGVQGGQEQSAPQQPSQEQPAMPGGALGASNLGVQQGLTANFGDEIMAGLMTPIEMGAQAIRGDDVSMSGAYNRNLERERGMLETAREQHPAATLAGELGGGVALGGQAMKGGLSLLNAAKPTARSMIGRGAGEGAAYGTAYGFGGGEGFDDRVRGAGTGLAVGGAGGGVLGAVGARGVNKAAQKAAPDTDAIRALKNDAYAEVDKLGARYTANAYDDLVSGVTAAARRDKINPLRHPKAASMLDEIASLKGQQPSLTELDQLRQVIRRDVANAADDGEAHFGRLMIDEIDDFIANAKPSHMAAAKPQDAANAIVKARSLHSRLKKSELIEDAVIRAERRAASTGSGGNLENAIRQNIRRILDNPKRAKFFTASEREAMEKVVRGSKTQDLVRLVGKLSPSGNGLMAALGLGATAYNPLFAIPAGVGIVSKKMAEGATARNVGKLEGMVRSGGQQAQPQLTDQRRKLLEALTVTGAQQAPGMIP